MPKGLSEVPELMRRARVATFATVDARARPHAVPVFFTYDEGSVYVQTDRGSVKVRNLRGNANVVVVVFHGYLGEEAVIIRGKGRVIEDESEFIKRTQEHIEKYHIRLDEEGRDGMGIPLFDAEIRCVIEVTPEKILYW
ncbi:MAG: pyridoxamine 5'-phosphate oxidase family protein [Candidatus Bathyarchaeia archaeon]